MIQIEQIEIPLSKNKMLLNLLYFIVFVGLGGLILINVAKSTSLIYTAIIFIVVFASILFFGVIFRMLSDKKAGLVINRQGIIDNSSGVAAGLVLWSDIEEIKIAKVMSQKFLMIIVKNPQEHINKITNPLKRKWVKMNYKSYGSPISISTHSLQINFDNLYNLLIEKMKEYKGNF